MKGLVRSIVAAGALAHTTYAALVNYDTGSGPKYEVGLPAGSSISSSDAGAIYFSLEAPDSFRWVGLGIGDGMAGASIFVMYAAGDGNVTISARDGNQGHVEPVPDSNLDKGVTLLAGSGISGGVMRANVKCTTCKLASSVKSSSPWITAWHQGDPINSDSQSATITQHDLESYRVISFDLTKASLSSDVNPFVAAAAPAPSSGPSSSGSPASGTKSATASATPTSAASSPTSTPSSGGDGDDEGDDTPSSSGGVTVVEGPSSAKTAANYQKAHGIVMGLTVVLLFPLGSVAMRLMGSWVIHAVLQLLALAMLIAGFALGVKLGDLEDLLYKGEGKTHTIFGTVIFALFLLQPIGGIIHHLQYRQTQTRTAVSHGHIWFGRAVMVLAVVNGGLGLKLANNTTGGKIAYGAAAGVMAVAYAVVVVVKRKRTESRWDGGKRERVESRDAAS